MSARDDLAAVIVQAYGEGAEECPCQQDLEVADAILAAGYAKPEPGVAEVQWGTSPFVSGVGVTVALSEDQAIWKRDHRGAHIYRRPVPAAWELVQKAPEVDPDKLLSDVQEKFGVGWDAIKAAQNGAHLTEAEKAMGLDGK